MLAIPKLYRYIIAKESVKGDKQKLQSKGICKYWNWNTNRLPLSQKACTKTLEKSNYVGCQQN